MAPRTAIRRVAGSAAMLLLLAACGGSKTGEPSSGGGEPSSEPSLAPAPAPEPPPPPPPPPISYRAWPIEDAAAYNDLAADLGPERLELVLKLNRLDPAHVRAGESLILPEGDVGADRLAPWPAEVPALAEVPKLVAVSRRAQTFGAYERGRLVRWGPTSTGRKETPTPEGLYSMNWKAQRTVSTDDARWVLNWYFNFHNRRGISFHEFELPGRPASHACVRLLEQDARWLYEWGEQWILPPSGVEVLAHGTAVLIFGEYAWDEEPPWRRLPEDPLAASVAAEELEKALAPHLALIEERARERDELQAAREQRGAGL